MPVHNSCFFIDSIIFLWIGHSVRRQEQFAEGGSYPAQVPGYIQDPAPGLSHI